MNNFLKKFALTGISLGLFLLISATGNAARLFLAPASSELYANCESAINIMIDTQGEESTAADALIDFNPAEVEVIDQNASIAGVQVRPGTVYEFFPGNKVESGRIYLTGASIMSNYKTGGSPEIMGSIILKNKPGVTSTNLNFYYLGASTIDSNVSDPTGSIDLLTSVGNGTYTFVDRGYCGSDTIAPVVSNAKPVPNSKGNPLNSNITFDVSDNLSGVKLSSVSVDIDGVVYKDGSVGFSSTLSGLKYSVTVDPVSDFLAETQVVVTINAQDNAGNVMSPPYRYSFNEPILDTQWPYVVNPLPAPGSTGNPLNSDVSFHVRDDMSGVDISTIDVDIDGIKYSNGDSRVNISGGPADYFVTINPDSDFILDTEVTVKIDAVDLKLNRMPTYSYNFNHPITDTQPPYVNNPKPTPGARNVPLDSLISFYLRDNVSGVDLNTVIVKIDGVTYLQGDFTTLSGSKNDYYIEIDPVSDFVSGKEITVTIEASDIRGNKMNLYTYKFNKPAVCGDNFVETDFGEECEPPNSAGCGSDCKFGLCSMPAEVVCGNSFVESGEACEPPGVGLCSETCQLLTTEPVTPETEIIDTYSEYAGFIGLPTEQQTILREMLTDSDGDGLSDMTENNYGTNPNSVDSDNDGVNDRDELLDYGTDPNVFDAEINYKLRIVHPENQAKTASGRLFVRGVSDPLRNVRVNATSLEGEKFDLGMVLATDNGKFALASAVDLMPGEYLLVAQNFNDDGTVFDTSDSVEIFIDPNLAIAAPRVRSINDIVIKLGELPQVPDPQPMITGTTEAGAQVVSVFESSIFSSTIISDATSGFFTLFAPRPLELGMHKVTVYAITPDGIISDAATVDFEVIKKLSFFASLGWWWFWLLLLLILIAIICYLYYKKRKKQKELDYMKKLVEPVFEQKVEDQIKGELGDKSGAGGDLFRRG